MQSYQDFYVPSSNNKVFASNMFAVPALPTKRAFIERDPKHLPVINIDDHVVVTKAETSKNERFVGMEGLVIKLPQHPNTWYKVRLVNVGGKPIEIALRRPAFTKRQLYSGDIRQSVNDPHMVCYEQSSVTSTPSSSKTSTPIASPRDMPVPDAAKLFWEFVRDVAETQDFEVDQDGDIVMY